MKEKALYFTGLTKSMVNGSIYAVLPGDPARSKSLAEALDPNASFVNINRQHTSYLANFHGQYILVISTGMGGPAVASVVEELVQLGFKKFIRIGTTGTIQESVNLGDIVISKAAVKLEGVSYQYAPKGYPAVASFSLTSSFVEGAITEKVPHHVGITASSDTFWPGQERYDNYSGYLLRCHEGSVQEWRALHVTNMEMEASALFTICSVFGLQAACFCGVIAKRTKGEEISTEWKIIAEKNWITVLRSGLYVDLKKENLIQE